MRYINALPFIDRVDDSNLSMMIRAFSFAKCLEL